MSHNRTDGTQHYSRRRKANVEENTILMCPKIKAISHYARKCCSFDYHFKYFQIKIVSQAKLYTKLKHCITYRVPVCNLSDDVTKLKKSYGNHMKANVEENIILMCPKIKATLYYAVIQLRMMFSLTHNSNLKIFDIVIKRTTFSCIM